MIWWLRVRSAPALLAALALVVGVAVLVPDSEVPVPSVAGSLSSGLPFRYLVPLLPVLLILYGQARADGASESVAVRPVRWLDTCFMTATVTALVLASAFVPDGVAVARNTAGYLGCALVLRWLSTPRLSLALITCLPFAVVSLGGRGGGQSAWWAWPLHEGTAPFAGACAAVFFGAGLALSFRAPLLGKGRGADD
ncbi:hypothetical protein ACFWZ2_37585 [Streptomyces sp. NPDC059002]|uniref:hypothetical protein n=1 Tax=Streptomyces sp. NPDC059002 TaxID=3346690 RepID=UPI00368CB45F